MFKKMIKIFKSADKVSALNMNNLLKCNSKTFVRINYL